MPESLRGERPPVRVDAYRPSGAEAAAGTASWSGAAEKVEVRRHIYTFEHAWKAAYGQATSIEMLRRQAS